MIFHPLMALIVSFILLATLLYKRVNLGLTLVCSALIMSTMSMDQRDVIRILIETSFDPITISLLSATFGIILLSQLYKETQAVESLSRSLSDLLENPKLVVSVLPAMIGLLPVGGGALMSAPMVEKEAERLGLEENEKAYVNVWFRHVIFPVYPLNQVLILAAALSGISIASLVTRQVPIVVTMGVIGYFTVLRKARAVRTTKKMGFKESFKDFLKFFSPIVITIFTVAVLGIDISIGVFLGIVSLIFITRPSGKILVKTISNVAIYKITLAAYGAMLLRSAIVASGVSEIISGAIVSSQVGEAVLVTTFPLILGVLTGSIGGIAIAIPILGGILNLSSNSASLIYISVFYGYLVSPTHLCLVLTADYFKCQLSKVYKLLVPSLATSFAVALLVYYVL